LILILIKYLKVAKSKNLNKMENALKLSVPVVVDLKIGPNWGEMKILSLASI